MHAATLDGENIVRHPTLSRLVRTSESEEVVKLSDIYQADINMAVWKRKLDQSLQDALLQGDFSSISTINTTVSLEYIEDLLHSKLPEGPGKSAITEDISYLVDLFTCLFDLQKVGFRLAQIDRAMCPRFHVDAVPCRLVTTYIGAATEWLPNEVVNRQKLGRGNNGYPDHASGLYRQPSNIHQLQPGDVALLKGESWLGNEEKGLVHRSPDASPSKSRLVLTLDFA